MKENVFRFGIVGAGVRGIGSHAKMLFERSDACVAAYCDSNRLRLEHEVAASGRPIAMYDDVTEMVRGENLDAVVIASPDCFHVEHAVAALESGVHVLIDKPLATTVAGCRAIIDAAERSGRTLMMGFNLRHHPVLVKLKELVSSGLAGEIFLLENREFYGGGRSYMARWNRLYAKSGGLWIHKGSHDFDVFQWLLDFPKPVKVSSFAGVNILNRSHLPFELVPGAEPGPLCHQCAYLDACPDAVRVKDIEKGAWRDEITALDGYYKDLCIFLSDKDTHDNGFAIVEYENGARASHMECFISGTTDRLYTLVGTKGQLEASLSERKIVFKPRYSKEVVTYELPPDDGGGHGGADPLLMEQFFRVLRKEAVNSATCEHGMYATAVGEAAEKARRENRVVMIEELFQ